MTEKDVLSWMDNIDKLIENKLNERFSNALLVKAGTITEISEDNQKASVQVLGEDTILENIEVYNVRHLNVGDVCHMVYWGKDGKRMNNVAVMFGGS